MKPRRNVLLVNPWIHDFAAYDFWVKPLGLLYLAGLLRENDYSVRLIDCLDSRHPSLNSYPEARPPKRKPFGQGKFARQVIPSPNPLRDIPRSYHRYGIPPALFLEELKRGEKPDAVLVTGMMTYWYPGVFDAIKMTSLSFPDTPVILGGNYVNFCPTHAATHSGADYVVPGVGERAIPDLFKSLFGDDFEFQPDPDDLDSYPYPAFDILPGVNQVSVITSRGCPFRCTYCASHRLNPVFRRRNPEGVAEEIAFWNRTLGVRDFSFYDDAFLFNPEEMAVPLMREIRRMGLDCRFHCPNGLHLRSLTEDIAFLLRKTGFTTLRFGFETSNPDSQAATGGKTTNQDLSLAVRSLRHAGFSPKDIGVYILCGLPGQTADEVRETILFVKSCGARPIIAEYSPIPGTALWQEAVAASPYPLTEEPLFHNNTLLPCRSDRLTWEDYRALKKLARENTLENE